MTDKHTGEIRGRGRFGEFAEQAAHALSRAAVEISANPVTLQLRYLQTLTEVASEKNSTLVFPLPIDLLKPFLSR